MSIPEEILPFAARHQLKETALDTIDEALDASIEEDKAVGIDFLEGHDKDELVYEFNRYEFRVDKNNYSKVVTRVNIYSNKLDRSHYDIPVGYYETWTDLDGQPLDDFLIFDWSVLEGLT